MRKYISIFIMIFVLFCVVGCSKVVGKVDYDKKLSLEEVKEYTKEELKQKYNIDVEISDVIIQDVSFCRGYFDGCYNHDIIQDANKYILKCKDNNGVIFDVTYIDAYIQKKKYVDVFFKDSYEEKYNDYLVRNDIINNFKAILSSNNITGYVYKPVTLDTALDFVILMNISDINKIKTVCSEFNKYLEKYRDSNYHLDYYLYVSDDEILNKIKEKNISRRIYELEDYYKIKNIYSNNENQYDIDYASYLNGYSKFAVLIHYNYFKNHGIKIETGIYGLENIGS